MEIIRAEESHTLRTSNTCVATEYPTSSTDINIARIEIRGRFPEKGVMWNTEVEEIVYVEKGEGLVSIGGVGTEIKIGDVVLYHKDEKVFWEGTLTLITACTPAWSPSQHRSTSE